MLAKACKDQFKCELAVNFGWIFGLRYSVILCANMLEKKTRKEEGLPFQISVESRNPPV